MIIIPTWHLNIVSCRHFNSAPESKFDGYQWYDHTSHITHNTVSVLCWYKQADSMCQKLTEGKLPTYMHALAQNQVVEWRRTTTSKYLLHAKLSQNTCMSTLVITVQWHFNSAPDSKFDGYQWYDYASHNTQHAILCQCCAAIESFLSSMSIQPLAKACMYVGSDT